MLGWRPCITVVSFLAAGESFSGSSFPRSRVAAPTMAMAPNAASSRTPLVSTTRLSMNGDERDGYDSVAVERPVPDGSEEDKGGLISQKILNLALPALVALAIDPLMTIADTAFVGRYSAPNDPDPLAGLGSAGMLI